MSLHLFLLSSWTQNFLAPGDEKIFIKKIKDILESKNFLKEEAKDTKRIANWKKKGKKSAEEIAAAEKEAAQKKAKVLLITDSPAVTQLFKVRCLTHED